MRARVVTRWARRRSCRERTLTLSPRFCVPFTNSTSVAMGRRSRERRGNDAPSSSERYSSGAAPRDRSDHARGRRRPAPRGGAALSDTACASPAELTTEAEQAVLDRGAHPAITGTRRARSRHSRCRSAMRPGFATVTAPGSSHNGRNGACRRTAADRQGARTFSEVRDLIAAVRRPSINWERYAQSARRRGLDARLRYARRR
jgi:hypothetical protein